MLIRKVKQLKVSQHAVVDPVCWFQLTRSQKEVNELPGLAEDKETEKKGYNKIHIISKSDITFIEQISVSLRNRKVSSFITQNH